MCLNGTAELKRFVAVSGSLVVAMDGRLEETWSGEELVKEKIQNHSITLEHISTKKMLADPLTKGLPPNVFMEHIAGMGLRESL